MRTIFKIEIQEILSRTIGVEAYHREEAVQKAMKAYLNEEIVLDSDDFVGVEFK